MNFFDQPMFEIEELDHFGMLCQLVDRGRLLMQTKTDDLGKFIEVRYDSCGKCWGRRYYINLLGETKFDLFRQILGDLVYELRDKVP